MAARRTGTSALRLANLAYSVSELESAAGILSIQATVVNDFSAAL